MQYINISTGTTIPVERKKNIIDDQDLDSQRESKNRRQEATQQLTAVIYQVPGSTKYLIIVQSETRHKST